MRQWTIYLLTWRTEYILRTNYVLESPRFSCIVVYCHANVKWVHAIRVEFCLWISWISRRGSLLDWQTASQAKGREYKPGVIFIGFYHELYGKESRGEETWCVRTSPSALGPRGSSKPSLLIVIGGWTVCLLSSSAYSSPQLDSVFDRSSTMCFTLLG